MVRHYKQKGNKLKWTEEDLRNAKYHFKHHHNNITAAARLFGVPRTTLYLAVPPLYMRRARSISQVSL